jgi:hypothetical protein
MKDKAYYKKYRKENLVKLREYKKLWQRNKRAEFKTQGLTVVRTPFKKSRKYIDPRNGHCEICSILLTSEYAKGGNDKRCGGCLNKI